VSTRRTISVRLRLRQLRAIIAALRMTRDDQFGRVGRSALKRCEEAERMLTERKTT
jgi:hypothetical protein